jgi:hypothetical protein
VTQHKQLAGRRFHGRAADEPRMANRFADEIIQYFTGERGPSIRRSPFSPRAAVASKTST